MTVSELLNEMWKDYVQISPNAQKIHDFFVSRGEVVVNDHIALRTYRHPRLGIKSLAKSFEDLGYREVRDYQFEAKKLYAKHYMADSEDLPKIFISELKTEEFSPKLQKIVEDLISQLSDEDVKRQDFSYLGRPWSVTYETYLELAGESEYAAWVSAFGFRPNHFTVSVNHLRTISGLEELNELVKSQGYPLNISGGEIKGTPDQLLEQSSTLAEEVSVQFQDGVHLIPSCYYEFAKRYAQPDGNLYHGFIAASADKIFESTDRRQKQM